MPEEKLSIIKTDARVQGWQELRDKLKEHGMEERSISGRLDKAVEIALWALDKKEKEIEKVKEEWNLP